PGPSLYGPVLVCSEPVSALSVAAAAYLLASLARTPVGMISVSDRTGVHADSLGSSLCMSLLLDSDMHLKSTFHGFDRWSKEVNVREVVVVDAVRTPSGRRM